MLRREDGGPVERAWLAVGIAEQARAQRRRRSGAVAGGGLAWDQTRAAVLRALMRAGGRPRRWSRPETGERRRRGGVAAALEVADRLGAGWLSGELHGLCARARLELAGSGADASGNGAIGSENGHAGDAESPFGLTPRELQVLTLIAEGATNRQIGAALYMAEKTASVHVSRILTKLGVRSRTQAAAMAHRLHLT